MFPESEIHKIKWNDISITRNNINGEAILVVLMFPDWQNGNDFLDRFLSKYTFTFGIKVDGRTGKYKFELVFSESDSVIVFPSDIPAKEVPYSSWFNKGIPAYITTGYWLSGRRFEFNKNILPLGEVNLN